LTGALPVYDRFRTGEVDMSTSTREIQGFMTQIAGFGLGWLKKIFGGPRTAGA
jgi:hypothetical protein